MRLARLNGDTVVEVSDIKTLFPNVSFPSLGPDATWLLDNSCAKVGTLSCDSATQTIQNSDPYLLDGVVYTRRVTDLTSAELDAEAATRNRATRNGLLADTDYMALSDVSMSAEMTTYRQALRDITSHANWPNMSDNDWPTKPE